MVSVRDDLPNPVRVLLIEDNPAEARLIIELLRDAGAQRFEVEHATCLDSVLQLAERADVILLDLSLPGTDGIETFCRVRSEVSTPVVVVSGHADENLALEAVGRGAQDYLVKGNFDTDGLARAIRYAISRDLTERALHESEARYRRFFQEDLTGDCVARIDGSILDCNAAFMRIFGFESAEQAGRARFADLFPVARRVDLVEKLRAEGRVEGFSMRARSRDGRALFVICNAVASPGEGPDPETFIAYFLDDTERREAEERLRRAQKMEAIGRLAGGLAHDFSNILTAITFHADYLLDRLEPSGPLRSRADHIKDASQRAASLVAQLLAFSSRQARRLEVLTLDEVVSSVCRMIRPLIGEDLEVIESTLARDGRIRADRGQLEQAILNLAMNSRDAMPEGGRLTLETRRVDLEESLEGPLGPIPLGPYLVMSVIDTGIGMSPEVRSNAFEPFFTTKDTGKGTGLGLAMVYGIVKQYQGYITVTSATDEGTRVSIYLPEAQGLLAEGSVKPQQKAHGSGGSESILVVEDDDALRSLMLEGLHMLGYRAIGAGLGEEACTLAESAREEIDLVIADIVMPDLRGPDLTQRLRRYWPKMKVLYMSGYSRGRSTVDESSSFIEKPFSPAALGKKVRRVLDSIPGSSG